MPVPSASRIACILSPSHLQQRTRSTALPHSPHCCPNSPCTNPAASQPSMPSPLMVPDYSRRMEEVLSSAAQLGGQTSSTSQPLRAKRAWLPGCLHLHLHTSERQSRGGHATLQRSSLCEHRIRLMTGNRHAARAPLTRAPHASGGSLAFSTIG